MPGSSEVSGRKVVFLVCNLRQEVCVSKARVNLKPNSLFKRYNILVYTRKLRPKAIYHIRLSLVMSKWN